LEALDDKFAVTPELHGGSPKCRWFLKPLQCLNLLDKSGWGLLYGAETSDQADASDTRSPY
jgi:hypothetical protein